MTRTRIAHIVCTVLATIALVGCGKHKSAPTVDLGGEYVPMSEYFALTSDSSDRPTWHDAYIPFKLSVFAPAQISLSGRATMVRDSAIYLSLRMMGIEGAVALITPDSLFVHDKYHKIYIADRSSVLLSGLGIGQAQDMLLGQPFNPGSDLDSICWVLPSAETGEIESLSFDLPAGAQAYCAYGQWKPTEQGEFAGLCDVLVFSSPVSESPSMQASIEWNIESAKFDSDRAINFKEPKDLQPVRVSDLMQLLMEMQ